MSTRWVTAPMLAFKHPGHIRASPEPDPGPAPIRTTPSPSYGRAIDPARRTACKHTRPARPRMQSPAATTARWAAVIATAAALAACGTPRVAAATPGGSAPDPRTLTYYAFDINNGAADPGFIPAPGTNPKAFAQGDELIINDQLTSTH